MIGLSTAIVAGTLGAMVSWQQLNLPTLATNRDVAELRKEIADVRQLNMDTRELTVFYRLQEVRRELSDLEWRQARDPDNRDLHRLIAQKRAEESLLEAQLASLRR